MNKSSNALALRVLIGRNIKLYLKDKMTVFFSVLAPVIVLLIYILFLGKMQADSIVEMLKGTEYADALTFEQAVAIVNNWMISGVMGVSCITVALNANIIMVRDRQNGAVNDIIASPVKRWVLYLSYIISCFVITFSICFIVLMLSICYLAGTGGLFMSFGDFLVIVCITIFSTLSSSFFVVLICGFVKTTSAMSALNGVFSAAIGFLIGAYLPFSMLPDYMQYIACFIPGTYSAGLFRNFFMHGIVNHIQIPPVASLDNLINSYFNLNFFGHTITQGWMVLVLLLSIVLFGLLIIVFYTNKKTNFFAQGKKRRKKK